MIHRICLNACHFMAQHKVQQDLWELILFPIRFASRLDLEQQRQQLSNMCFEDFMLH